MKPTSTSMHVSLYVSDLAASTSFYAALFGSAPAKQRAGYAKFELAEPALVMSLLQAAERVRPGALSHLGTRLGSNLELEAERERVRAAGLEISLEETDVACCYARQDKFWVSDPDGNAWEFYVFLGDVESDPQPSQGSACCGPQLACSGEFC